VATSLGNSHYEARQGKLTEALNDLSLLLANTKGNSSELALEERAELKSIMDLRMPL